MKRKTLSGTKLYFGQLATKVKNQNQKPGLKLLME